MHVHHSVPADKSDCRFRAMVPSPASTPSQLSCCVHLHSARGTGARPLTGRFATWRSSGVRIRNGRSCPRASPFYNELLIWASTPPRFLAHQSETDRVWKNTSVWRWPHNRTTGINHLQGDCRPGESFGPTTSHHWITLLPRGLCNVPARSFEFRDRSGDAKPRRAG